MFAYRFVRLFVCAYATLFAFIPSTNFIPFPLTFCAGVNHRVPSTVGASWVWGLWFCCLGFGVCGFVVWGLGFVVLLFGVWVLGFRV